MSKRHKHFGSFRSSQALAQSVFGALHALGKLDALAELKAEEGRLAFFATYQGQALELEHEVTALGELERARTSVDVWLFGRSRVAVEAKFAEQQFSPCTQPEWGRCSGAYAAQMGRASRCTLTGSGIRYWEFLPELFDWDTKRDHSPCPLRSTYQLARNVLAAACTELGAHDVGNAHVLALYDARNPAFRPGGSADRQWREAISALKVPHMLRRVSWQELLAHLAQDDELRGLVAELEAKYGLASVVHPS